MGQCHHARLQPSRHPGGASTAGPLARLVIFVLSSWRMFFAAVHVLFVPPDAWTFDWSNVRIPLHYDRLWFEGATFVTVGTLLASAVVGAAGYALSRRQILGS